MKKLFAIAAVILLSFSVASYAQVSFASIFRSWGFIGDSLCSGEMECYGEGEDFIRFVDMYEYSWGQQLCRLTGSEGWNFSHGGQTAHGWLNEMEGERGWGYAKTHPKQAYIIAMGVNDYYTGLGGAEWASFENYTKDLHQIIDNVKSIQPDAKFFVLTRPKEDLPDLGYDKWNDVIRELPSIYENVYVIDMYRDAPVYDKTFKDQYYLNGHLSPAGYLWTAEFLMKEIDRIIRENLAEFKNAALIGTPWRTSKW